MSGKKPPGAAYQALRKSRRREVLVGYPRRHPFASTAEARSYLAEPRIQCLRCGKTYMQLGSHLNRIHGWTADQYKTFYRLPLTAGLACEETRQTFRDAMTDRSLGGLSHVGEMGVRQPNRPSGFKDMMLAERNASEETIRGERGRWVEVPDRDVAYEDVRTRAYALGFTDALGWVLSSFERTVHLNAQVSRGNFEGWLSVVDQAGRLFEAAGSDPDTFEGHVRRISSIEPHLPIDDAEAN